MAKLVQIPISVKKLNPLDEDVTAFAKALFSFEFFDANSGPGLLYIQYASNTTTGRNIYRAWFEERYKISPEGYIGPIIPKRYVYEFPRSYDGEYFTNKPLISEISSRGTIGNLINETHALITGNIDERALIRRVALLLTTSKTDFSKYLAELIDTSIERYGPYVVDTILLNKLLLLYEINQQMFKEYRIQFHKGSGKGFSLDTKKGADKTSINLTLDYYDYLKDQMNHVSRDGQDPEYVDFEPIKKFAEEGKMSQYPGNYFYYLDLIGYMLLDCIFHLRANVITNPRTTIVAHLIESVKRLGSNLNELAVSFPTLGQAIGYRDNVTYDILIAHAANAVREGKLVTACEYINNIFTILEKFHTYAYPDQGVHKPQETKNILGRLVKSLCDSMNLATDSVTRYTLFNLLSSTYKALPGESSDITEESFDKKITQHNLLRLGYTAIVTTLYHYFNTDVLNIPMKGNSKMITFADLRYLPKNHLSNEIKKGFIIDDGLTASEGKIDSVLLPIDVGKFQGWELEEGVAHVNPMDAPFVNILNNVIKETSGLSKVNASKADVQASNKKGSGGGGKQAQIQRRVAASLV